MDELWANAKARSKARFIWFLVFLWSGLILYLIANSANPFSAYDTLDCESMTVTDMKNGSSVKGMLSDVADCIASSETSSRWGNYTDSYYWVAILDNDTSIIVRTKSDTNTVSKYMSVADSFWFGMDLHHWENRRQTSGISVDGVLVPNDKEAVEFYEEWYKMSNLKSIGADFKLAPYMLDVTKTKSGKIVNFWLLLLVLVLTVLMAVYIIKKHTNSKIRSQSRAVSYATGSGNKSDTYSINQKSSYESTSAISGTVANGSKWDGMYGLEQRRPTYGSANTSSGTAENRSQWDGMYGSEQRRPTYGSANTSSGTAENRSQWDGMYGSEQRRPTYGSANTSAGTATNENKWDGMYGSEQRRPTYGSANTSAETAANGSQWDGMYGSEQRSTYGSANTSAGIATNENKWDGMYGSEQRRPTYGSANTSSGTVANGSKWNGMYGTEAKFPYESADTTVNKNEWGTYAQNQPLSYEDSDLEVTAANENDRETYAPNQALSYENSDSVFTAANENEWGTYNPTVSYENTEIQ